MSNWRFRWRFPKSCRWAAIRITAARPRPAIAISSAARSIWWIWRASATACIRRCRAANSRKSKWRAYWRKSGPGTHQASRNALFLDEPTTSLYIHHQIHLLDIARGLLDRHCTVIAILHDLNVALHYGDSFFVLDGGRLVHEADGAEQVPGELIERVFSVRAHQVVDAANAERIWRFSLET